MGLPRGPAEAGNGGDDDHRVAGDQSIEERLSQVPHGQAVDGEHQVSGRGARDTGHIDQTVIGAVEAFQGGIDAARAGQVDLDVVDDRCGGSVAVQGVDLGSGGQESFGHCVPDS
jgi:hypothetical protein